MVRVIERTQQWIYSRSAPEIAETISPFFPALDRGVLAAALARYQGSRCGDAIRSCPRTALIVCGDVWSRAGSSVGRRIPSLHRQSPRPASSDRIGFAHGLDARADRQPGIKADSGTCLPRGADYAVGQTERAGQYCSSSALGHFDGPTSKSLAELKQTADRTCLRTR